MTDLKSAISFNMAIVEGREPKVQAIQELLHSEQSPLVQAFHGHYGETL